MCRHHSQLQQCTLFKQCSKDSYESRRKRRLLFQTEEIDRFPSVECAFNLVLNVLNIMDDMYPSHTFILTIKRKHTYTQVPETISLIIN